MQDEVWICMEEGLEEAALAMLESATRPPRKQIRSHYQALNGNDGLRITLASGMEPSMYC